MKQLLFLIIFSALHGLCSASDGIYDNGTEVSVKRPLSQMSAGVDVRDLRCEYLSDPLAVGATVPRLSWRIEAKPGHYNCMQSAYRVLAASDRRLLDANVGDLWDSGKILSSESGQICYGGEMPAETGQCFWKVCVWDNNGRQSAWSDVGQWGRGVKRWSASWIGDREDADLKRYKDYVAENCRSASFDVDYWKNPPTLASPLLRKTFALKGKVRRAVVYASAIGYYGMWINGQRVGNSQLAPEWTDYKEFTQYQAYDVTDLLEQGENVWGATLADGWALGRLAGVKWMRSFPHRGFYADDRRLIGQLVIEMENGNVVTVNTDGTWRLKNDGFVLSADNFGGEKIDARKIPSGWLTKGYDDSDWEQVCVADSVPTELRAQPNEPITVHKVLEPVRIWKRGDRYMVDFGQNIAGRCALRVKGNRGTEITVRYGEWLNDDGSLYRESLGYAASTDRFILSGGDDYFDPEFTYHGFQYVEVEGLEGELTPGMIEAKAISSSANGAGSFRCSDDRLNRLFGNIIWTQRNNMTSVFTDNPSRDERTGAMGDIQIFAQSSIFNMDMSAFYTKYLADMKDVAANGQFMSMIPSLRNPGFWDGWIGAPGWCEAAFIVPWRLYENYGDKRALEALYPEMTGHIEATLRENPDKIWRVRHNHNGDWLNANTITFSPDSTFSTSRGATPDDLFATAFFAYSTRLLGKIAAVLGKESDADRYGTLADEIREVFIREFVGDDGTVAGDSQGAYSLALYYDLVPEQLRAKCFGNLLRCIEEYDYRLSTGFVTTPMMMQLLVDFNRADVAYGLLTSTRFPSWLYIVNAGASTVWERWDTWIPGHGFQNPTMNSLDHVAFGAVAEWIYRNVLGINPDPGHPGYASFMLRPLPGGGLNWAEGSYKSIRGEIKSSWRTDGDRTIYKMTVPPNSNATVELQAEEAADVRCMHPAGAVKFVRGPEGKATARIGSGDYEFEVVKPL